MYRTGLVIGKFLPPHRGHHLLIDTARSQAERVTVIVCDRPDQPISGNIRAGWLSEVHPDVEVRVAEDSLDPDDSRVWAEQTVRWLGYIPDAVFTSEVYGDAYAKFMGCTHVCVDLRRRRVPCTGRRILADPFAHWEFLEPCVRAHFVKRVCVVGAESSGTTTMAHALADHYKTAWVREYGREYAEEKLRADDNAWRGEEFVHIASVQSRREDKVARLANRLLICDTDAFTTGIWHERYMGFRSREVEAIAKTRRCDLYLITDIDIPFVQDGTRDGEHVRAWMHRRFLEQLAEQVTPYAVLSGSRERRLQTAVRLIEPLLKPGGANHRLSVGAQRAGPTPTHTLG
ncbi:MAG TPA: AAA family ATPase [Candidatus Dormibacteraeota bacterium]|jgi:NadR type nicotinamide-nucleotide adenylyltransferase|nr:AAA family ATPase [Candidatus Dormibacteraeota bacterium]